MASEPRKSRRALRVFALALTSCLALAAASASTAGAISIHSAGGGELEFPFDFAISGGSFALNGTEEHHRVVCDEETTGSGTLAHERHGTVTLEFHDCTLLAGWSPNCQTSGAEIGTIVTKPLAMDLVELPEEAHGMVLAGTVLAEVGNVAEFNCGFAVEGVWSGSMIAEIPAPYYTETTELAAEIDVGSGGAPKYTETADGREAHLMQSINGEEAQEMAGDGSVDLVAEEGEVQLLEGGEVPYLMVLNDSGPLGSLTPVAVEPVTVQLDEEKSIECTSDIDEEEWAMVGSGEFSSPSEGEAELTLQNCKEKWTAFEFNCYTPGEESGTIALEPVSLELVDRSESIPGFAIDAGGLMMHAECTFLIDVKVYGDTEADITSPDEFNKPNSWLVTKFAESGSNLEASVDGEELKPASLDMRGFWFADFTMLKN